MKAVKIKDVFFSKDSILYPINKNDMKYQINYEKKKIDVKSTQTNKQTNKKKDK